MKWLVGISIFVLCVFDSLATIYAIEHNFGIETNPLVLLCIKYLGYSWFLLIKAFLSAFMFFLVVIFWRRFKVARVGGVLVASVYFILTVYHLVGLTA